MQNFVFRNPTRIVFGKGTIPQLGHLVPTDVPVLLLCGGGSIRNNGVYDQVSSSLAQHQVHEFWGITPNPLYETCLEALELVRAEKIGFLLSVGGGSVLDAAKFIAAAARFENGDPWQILSDGAEVHDALPVGAVLTLPATGSEANGNAVISRESTREKLPFGSEQVYPVFSILDPETTFSLPRKQIRNGVIDAFVHVVEQYATYDTHAPVQDRVAEGVLQTLVEVGATTLNEPRNYEARAAFMWSATVALQGLIGAGVAQDWSTHMIGHELTAFYGVDHAESLAIVLPGVWRAQLETKHGKLAQMGQRVFGVQGPEAAIAATEDFFKSLEMPLRLGEYGIDAEDAVAKVTARFEQRRSRLGERRDITPRRVAEILRARV
jgi:NADP-dependent alcohol dehydrogenase